MLEFPVEMRPHERAIMLVYFMERRNAARTVRVLGYRNKSSVYRVIQRWNSRPEATAVSEQVMSLLYS